MANKVLGYMAGHLCVCVCGGCAHTRACACEHAKKPPPLNQEQNRNTLLVEEQQESCGSRGRPTGAAEWAGTGSAGTTSSRRHDGLSRTGARCWLGSPQGSH